MTDDLVQTLKRLDGAEYPGGGTLLDPALVIRAGRRRATTRRIAITAAAGALVVALAVGVPAAIAGRTTTTPPAGGTPSTVHQEPRPFGSGPVATFAPDYVAVNIPDEQSWRVLTADEFAGWDVTIAGSPTSDGTAGVVISVSSPDFAEPWTNETRWRIDDSADDYSDTVYGSTVPMAGEDADGSAHSLLFGALPSWQRDPVAVLVSTEGWTAADGTVRHAMELPTFRAPTDDGRLMFLVGATGEDGRRLVDGDLLVFVGADGDVFVPACSGAGDAPCLSRDSIPLTQWLNEPLAHFTDPAAPSAIAPEAREIGPGIWASLGLAEAGQMEGDDGVVGTNHLAGSYEEASVHVGIGLPADPTLSVWAVVGDSVTQKGTGASDPRLLDPAPLYASSFLNDPRMRVDAVVLPPGAVRAFHAANRSYELADGARHYAFEIPTFPVPQAAATYLDPDQRMYVLGWIGDASYVDGESATLYVTADGRIVDPSCGSAECTRQWASEAYDEILALLGLGAPTPCAEFPAADSPMQYGPGDIYEGWWNSSPADENANILRDPAQWPARVREHPRVALVSTDTAQILSTWDRVACGPAPDYVPTPQADWPAGSVAVVDMDTGETVGTFAARD